MYSRQLQQFGRNMCSMIRHNFSPKCEVAINKQINLELKAGFVYMAMANHFGRCDVALPGIQKYFKQCADEEYEHAFKFMEYLNLRGGRVELFDVECPKEQEWNSAEAAMEAALELEKFVNSVILELHSLASNECDGHLTSWLEEEFLDEQVEAIKEIADHLTNIRRVGDDVGVYIFDKKIMKKSQ